MIDVLEGIEYLSTKDQYLFSEATTLLADLNILFSQSSDKRVAMIGYHKSYVIAHRCLLSQVAYYILIT